jgi:hypothetical protein
MGNPRNKCGKCGYTWYPKGHAVSRKCPNCESTDVKIESISCTGLVGIVAVALIGYYACDYFKVNRERIVDGINTISPKDTPPHPVTPFKAVTIPTAQTPQESPAKLPPKSVELPLKATTANTTSPSTPTINTAVDKAKEEEAAKAAAKLMEKEVKEKEATRLLMIGKNFELNKMNDYAATKYKEVILKYPDTDAARECKSRLEYFDFKNSEK